jgi:diguanylate cyclase (GGDEF)-like protein
MFNAPSDSTVVPRLALPVAPSVLIIDDDELVLERLKDLVAASGYRVRTTMSGLSAIAMLETSSDSIVIADLSMPSLGGLELCRRIRALNRRAYVYIILLTVSDDEKDVLAGLDAGADDYISKRTSAAQFIARLRTANRVLALEYSMLNALKKKHELAMTDELTGVRNRRYFSRRVAEKLKLRNTPGCDISMLLIDIDHFKKVNDTYGHSAGDIVLKGVTRQITGCLRRETDWCARLGGEEFAVVLEGAGPAEARACAERVRLSIGAHSFTIGPDSVRVTVSIGVSGLTDIANRQSASALSLLACADKNLFASKAGGRNRVTWSNPDGTLGTSGDSALPKEIQSNANTSLSPVRRRR